MVAVHGAAISRACAYNRTQRNLIRIYQNSLENTERQDSSSFRFLRTIPNLGKGLLSEVCGSSMEGNMRAFRIAAAMFVAAALVWTSLAVVSADRGDRDEDHSMTVWVAMMQGGFEATTPRDTPAKGVAVFLVGEGSVDYLLVVARISNVFAAHIHCGAPGVAAPVGVTLFMGTPGSGPAHGVLVRSSFTGPDAGTPCAWTTLADVVSAVESGNAYVNVHTSDGVDPANTGPGDFPGGEIRGTLRVAGDDED
jgi:CHRD domain-containing protein